ncbi:WecB/TagA/CpsF family glycosyltransferase [Rubellimicrobium arenae]|uniref:WecB/TagA/CpsF family glycosyltransferase n=1 Tax=Rubellimicrobium arenae TaxID=2817372 RepID=UPI001B3145A8|nr:WecB/TagA/CpsF family glycosyltransferase [Rubellimicrobium arenae]
MFFPVGDRNIKVNVAHENILLDEIGRRFAVGEGFALATLNLDHLVKLRTNTAFRAAYAKQDLITADGNPIVWLARAAKQPVDLLPGSDLIRPVLRVAAAAGVPVGFIGSTEASLTAASTTLCAEIPDLDVRACVAPPMGFDPNGSEALRILDDLAKAGVRLVLVALGAPKQELLAAVGRARHPGLAFLSIGAGLDFISGEQRRAPVWMRRLALEWLWRAMCEPRRLAPRYLRAALIFPTYLSRAMIEGLVKGRTT